MEKGLGEISKDLLITNFIPITTFTVFPTHTDKNTHAQKVSAPGDINLY